MEICWLIIGHKDKSPHLDNIYQFRFHVTMFRFTLFPNDKNRLNKCNEQISRQYNLRYTHFHSPSDPGHRVQTNYNKTDPS